MNAYDICLREELAMDVISGNWSLDHTRFPKRSYFIDYPFEEYFNRASVQKQLHIID